MRISDWSSDVCSSDLGAPEAGARGGIRHSAALLHPHLQRPAEADPSAAALGGGRLLRCRGLRNGRAHPPPARRHRSEEHTSELQSLMRISYAVFCLKKKKKTKQMNHTS